MRRALFGALAGTCATMAMTAAMRRLHRALPADQRYPLPPREITSRTLPAPDARSATTAAILAHFGFGALAGAVYGCLPRPRPAGFVYGPAVWAVSYLGWVPAGRILAPADDHPGRRNALMLLVHVVWGTVLSVALDELNKAAEGGFGPGRSLDAEPQEAKDG
ncbi:hypothetical protein [Nitratireductor thuwali]|uniref:DUF1440 domain-containing protein n=1 Tax=Nitratireductor thuwali TaxID=2267699 RepID=A0ABY5ML46_9HYPH|nr:hypothetical protein NTH_03193 [Nitratireductor thuwali]